MKHSILSNWTIIRFLRLGMGIAILVQAVIAKDVLFAFLGLAFTAMSVFNIGCCSPGGCYTAPNQNQDKTKDITYEEVV